MRRFLGGAMLISVLGLVGATGHATDRLEEMTKISLGQPVTFDAPSIGSVTVAAGEYFAGVSSEGYLQLAPVGGGEPFSIRALATRHEEEGIESPLVVFFGARSRGQEEIHVVLLLPGGDALEAIGAPGEVLSRGHIAKPASASILSQGIRRQMNMHRIDEKPTLLPSSPSERCSQSMGALACEDIHFEGYAEMHGVSLAAPEGYEITNWTVVVHEATYARSEHTHVNHVNNSLRVIINTEGWLQEGSPSSGFEQGSFDYYYPGVYRASYYIYGNPIPTETCSTNQDDVYCVDVRISGYNQAASRAITVPPGMRIENIWESSRRSEEGGSGSVFRTSSDRCTINMQSGGRYISIPGLGSEIIPGLYEATFMYRVAPN